MKKSFIILIICALVFPNLKLNAQNFEHPGCLHTREDFDRMKQIIKEGTDSKAMATYRKLQSSPYASSSFSVNATSTITCGGVPGQNQTNAARQSAAAYQTALRWKLGDGDAYGKKAIEILNAWARTCKKIDGDSNYALGAGFHGYQFANAAEIMRDYEGWSREDFEAFKEFMRTVFLSQNYYFLITKNGTIDIGKPTHYPTNWGFVNVLSAISIGILCDDPFIYNFSIQYYKYDLMNNFEDHINPESGAEFWISGLTEFIGNGVPVLYTDKNTPYGYIGQMQESGRDRGHALLAVGLPVDICKTAWNQGDDLFSWMDNRLAAGIEFEAAVALYGLEAEKNGIPLDSLNNGSQRFKPWTTIKFMANNSGLQTHDGVWFDKYYAGDRAFWPRVIHHYEGIKGITPTYSKRLYEQRTILNTDGGYGTDNFNGDHLGFTALTDARPAITNDKAPTPLKAFITYDSKTMERGELLKVKKGEIIKMSPQLPDGVTGGSWKWETGESTQELTITADRSRTYRVYYTNEKGVKSTQLFSIAVTGDWIGDKVTPKTTINGIESNDTIISILPGTTVKMEIVTAMTRGGNYSWNTGTKGTSIEISNIRSARTYIAKYTDIGGKVHTVNFYIKITPIKPALKIDGTAQIETNTAYVEKGQSVTLAPKTQSNITGATWAWSDGSYGTSLSLENIQSTQSRSLIFTLNGIEYTLDYEIYVKDSNKQMTEGNYYIKDFLSGLYLTNDGTTTPSFSKAILTSDSISQMWTITKDGSRYKILSAKDQRYVNEHARFGTNPYYTEWNTYTFHGIDKKNVYSIQNGGSAGTTYWISNGANITGLGSSSMPDYPFEISQTRELSGDTSIENNYFDKSHSISIYPNPVENMFRISAGETMQGEQTTFKLFSLEGKLLKSVEYTNDETEINIANFPKGIYTGVLSSKNIQKTIKIIKK